jgi:catechol 2,3-dioxygenase-like lactoylglutathione lyase family enzyme
MAVKRIVADIAVKDTAQAQTFYGNILGMVLVMDMGWMFELSLAKQRPYPNAIR